MLATRFATRHRHRGVVLDLGCGGGIDSILAVRRVGPTGTTIAVDLLGEMCERARQASEQAGVAAWCDVLDGEMEALPLIDSSVEVVIPNGVLNLSRRKSRALAEIARVLVPGGRLYLTDLVVDQDLPPEVLASGAAWAGCIAGAVSERVLVGKLTRTGFVDIEIEQPVTLSLDDVEVYPLFTAEVVALMRRVIPAEVQRSIARSVTVRATWPGSSPAGVGVVSCWGLVHHL